MISVFQGKSRGISGSDNENFLKLNFEFRKIICDFHGARLAVFMCIALHCDENGHCYPSYDTLERETGYGRDTIARALDDLCAMKINDHRILVRYRLHDDNGKFVGSNQYLIFPETEELNKITETEELNKITETEYQPQLGFPTVVKTNYGKSLLKEDPLSIKEDPLRGVDTPISLPTSELSIEDQFSAMAKLIEPTVHKTREERIASTLQAMVRGAQKESGRQAEGYPTDIAELVGQFSYLFQIPYPTDKTGKNDWINGARRLLSACGAMGIGALEKFKEDYDKRKDKFDITTPRSLVTEVNAWVGKQTLRQESAITPKKGEGFYG